MCIFFSCSILPKIQTSYLENIFLRDPFIIYGQLGGKDSEGGPLFWQVARVGHIYGKFSIGGTFLAAPIFKKPAESNFLRVLGKYTLRKIKKNISRGNLFLATSVRSVGDTTSYFWQGLWIMNFPLPIFLLWSFKIHMFTSWFLYETIISDNLNKFSILKKDHFMCLTRKLAKYYTLFL